MIPQRSVPLRARLLTSTALVAAGLGLSTTAAAGPQQGTVAAGQAGITQSGGTTTVTQSSSKAIVNWQSFSVGKTESVQFQQPNRSAITLNRVQGPGASDIQGSLTANGQVWLVNPNGVLFGQGASVNVGGLLATTSNISDQNFMAGKYVFDQASPNPNARVVNQGTINVAPGGYAALSAAAVENTGTVNATMGTVVLGGAKTFTVDFQGDKLLSYQVGQPVDQMPVGPDGKPVAALVQQGGTIAANGGRVVMSAAAAKGVIDNAINLTGVVRANTIRQENGVVVIGAVDVDGGANGNVQLSGRIEANGAGVGSGGAVSVAGDRVTLASGATVDATSTAPGTTGGQVTLKAATVINNAGVVDASGDRGGAIAVSGAVVLHQGTLKADGARDAGGQVGVAVTQNYVDTEGAKTSAQGTRAGGTIAVTGGAGSAVFTSGTMSTTASAGVGGAITVTAPTVSVVAATLDASGATGGGTIKVGGDAKGQGTTPKADTVYVNAAAKLKADATVAGNAGSIAVWSEKSTTVRGTLSARGGAAGGDGGTLEVSSKGTSTFSGTADATAPKGKVGSLLIDPKDIVIDSLGGISKTDFVDPTPSVGNGFGSSSVIVLSNGNVVVTAPNNNAIASGAGAAYLFNGSTGGLISTMTGLQANDHIGQSATALTNGNYVITSPQWNGNAGAVTWGSASTGVSGSTITATNSVFGSVAGDRIGSAFQHSGIRSLEFT